MNSLKSITASLQTNYNYVRYQNRTDSKDSFDQLTYGVRLSRLLFSFQMNLKYMQFHSLIHSFIQNIKGQWQNISQITISLRTIQP